MVSKPANECNRLRFLCTFTWCLLPYEQPWNGLIGAWEEGRGGATRLVFAHFGTVSTILLVSCANSGRSIKSKWIFVTVVFYLLFRTQVWSKTGIGSCFHRFSMTLNVWAVSFDAGSRIPMLTSILLILGTCRWAIFFAVQFRVEESNHHYVLSFLKNAHVLNMILA